MVRIKDLENGLISAPLDLVEFINNPEEIEFDFPDDTSLPYNDFRFYRQDYEVIIDEITAETKLQQIRGICEQTNLMASLTVHKEDRLSKQILSIINKEVE